jgi:RimJ/RimL family protein N-acetyltransferase
MFARTERLLLRPGWAEDAPALAAAISHDSVTSNLSWGRWPAVRDVESWLRSHDPALPSLMILSRASGAPELIGGSGLHRTIDGGVELDFWISPHRRGLGFATEAARAMLGIAQALGVRMLAACAFTEQGAASRVLEKLGFLSSEVVVRQSAARSSPASVMRYSRSVDPRHPGPVPLLAA